MGRYRVLGGCVVAGCERGAVAKGLCGLHYGRAWRGADLIAPLRAERAPCQCSAPKCRKAAKVKGLCLFHYGRLLKGVPLDQPKQRHRESVDYDASRGCHVLGCGRKVAGRGMCWAHYRREKRGQPVYVYLRATAKTCSTVMFGPPKPSRRVLRLAVFEWWLREGLVTPEPNTGCLLWLGSYNPVTGYPALGNGDGRDPWGSTAHRAALHFSGVKLERGNRKLHARHLCDNPGCVAAAFNAPVAAHVVYGTAKENMADRERRYVREQRVRHGRKPWKLTPSLVEYVREAHALGVSKAELARDLGVHWQTVDHAVRSAAPHPQQHAA
jgi:hypothetical protein